MQNPVIQRRILEKLVSFNFNKVMKSALTKELDTTNLLEDKFWRDLAPMCLMKLPAVRA